MIQSFKCELMNVTRDKNMMNSDIILLKKHKQHKTDTFVVFHEFE